MIWGERIRKQWQQQRWMNYPLLTGLAASVVGLTLLGTGGWDPLERLVYNILLPLRSRVSPMTWTDQVVVVAIDEASLAEYGRFPWTRDHYVDLMDTLLPTQPAAIGFDLILTETTPHDTLLGNSIALSGNVVMAVGDDGTGQVLDLSPAIAQVAQGSFLLGHVKHQPDPDGFSRRVSLYEGQFPSFGVALVQMYQTSLSNTLGGEVPQAESVTLPQPEQQTTWLNWPAPIQPDASTGPTIVSFADVAEGRIDTALLQNKIVLVGVTAAAMDPVRNPFHTDIPTSGVFLQAAVVDNILHDRFLQRPPRWFTACLIVMLGIATSLALHRSGPKARILLLLSLGPMGLAIAYFGLLHHLWLPIAAPIGTSLMSAIAIQFVEQRERKALMELLSLNTSPEMAELMWQHKAELLTDGQIQPRMLTATVLFSDIRSFTRITETLPSEVLLPWLNRYFEVMTDCIMAHGGVVDKYIGDAIMAVFGVPFPRTQSSDIQQDAIAAVSAGVAMYQALQSLNQEFEAAGLPTIQFGIGIHTGSVIAGTVGSRRRISYSLFGDTVNVASRLQDMTKTFSSDVMPVPCLLSEETHGYVGDRYPSRHVANIQLRGRTTQTPVYTLTHRPTSDTEGIRLPQALSSPILSPERSR